MHRRGAPRRLDQDDRQARSSPTYIERDDELAETLHKFRSSGKRLFLLTNSAWDYTEHGHELPARRRARGLPDLAELLRRRHRERDEAGVLHATSTRSSSSTRAGAPTTKPQDGALPARAHLPGRQPQGLRGARAHERRPRALRRRPHLRRHAALAEVVDLAHGDGAAGAGARGGDLRSACGASCAKLDRLDAELIHLDAELNEQQSSLRALQKLGDQTPGSDQVVDARRSVKAMIETLRKALRATTAQHRTLEAEIDHALQPVLGPALPRGLRDQQVRRAGRGLRLRLHEPRLELPLLLAHAVLPRPARPHAARAVARVNPRARASNLARRAQSSALNRQLGGRAARPVAHARASAAATACAQLLLGEGLGEQALR